MDILFFLIGCLFLAETIDLFCNRDFLIFVSDTINPADYDIKKVYSVEKWLFAIDTLASYSISFHLGGMIGDFVMLAVIFATMIAHWWVFKSPKFRVPGRTPGGKKEEVIWTGSAWADAVPAPEISGAFSFYGKVHPVRCA